MRTVALISTVFLSWTVLRGQNPNAEIQFSIFTNDSIGVYFKNEAYQNPKLLQGKNDENSGVIYIVSAYKSWKDTDGNEKYSEEYKFKKSPFGFQDSMFRFIGAKENLTGWGAEHPNYFVRDSASRVILDCGFGGYFILVIGKGVQDNMKFMRIGFKNVSNFIYGLTIKFSEGNYVMDVDKITAEQGGYYIYDKNGKSIGGNLTPKDWKSVQEFGRKED